MGEWKPTMKTDEGKTGKREHDQSRGGFWNGLDRAPLACGAPTFLDTLIEELRTLDQSALVEMIQSLGTLARCLPDGAGKGIMASLLGEQGEDGGETFGWLSCGRSAGWHSSSGAFPPRPPKAMIP